MKISAKKKKLRDKLKAAIKFKYMAKKTTMPEWKLISMANNDRIFDNQVNLIELNRCLNITIKDLQKLSEEIKEEIRGF